MKRALAVAAVLLALATGACGDDDGNSPQRDNTGDTLEDPTTSSPPSTTND